MENEETKTTKDITDQYTGEEIEEPSDEELNYEEEDEGANVDATALGVDADQIGHLTALGLSYLIVKPKKIEIQGENYNLQQNYINSTKNEYAELAKGLNLETHLQELNIGQLSPGQAIGAFALLSTGLVFKQRKEFQAELEKLKQQKGNGSDMEEDENNGQ